jgi:hypothetical protein
MQQRVLQLHKRESCGRMAFIWRIVHLSIYIVHLPIYSFSLPLCLIGHFEHAHSHCTHSSILDAATAPVKYSTAGSPVLYCIALGQSGYKGENCSEKLMGLDGGTQITRSDVLRGSSWRLANCDSSRSTRGGAVSAAGTYQVLKS